jgi:hypothetical protein
MIRELDKDKLEKYYDEMRALRALVLEAVQRHGYNVTDLVTKRIEHEIEQVYGEKLLND